MKDYSEMSDFEINKAVADLQGLYWHCKPSSAQNKKSKWLFSDNYDKCDTSNGQVAVDLPDYCNSWEYMGPIIEHSRELQKALSNEKFIWYKIPRPLRFAAIVYLKSKEK